MHGVCGRRVRGPMSESPRVYIRPRSGQLQVLVDGTSKVDLGSTNASNY